jgi:transposase
VLAMAALVKPLSIFDDVGVSAFHSCVVVDLLQFLSEWHLLLSAYVLVCRRENVGHTALSRREFLATKQIAVLENPAYSPDLAPIGCFLFSKIKEILKGRYFDDTDDIRSNTTAALKAIRPFHKTSSKIVLKDVLGAGIDA